MLEALAALVKALLYGGMLTAAGAAFADATLRADALKEHAQRLVYRGVLLMLVAAAIGALLLVIRLSGQFDSATLAAVFTSSNGAALGLQAIGALLLLAPTAAEPSRAMRVANGALFPLSLAFNGHAAAAGPFESVFAFAHASLAAWWIASLWLLRHACVHLDAASLAQLVRRFASIATRIVGALIVAGLWLVLMLAKWEFLPAFSAYEQLLAVKLLFVALTLAIAAYNKFKLTPRLLANDIGAATALRRAIDIELGLLACVLAATAILTTFASPHD